MVLFTIYGKFWCDSLENIDDPDDIVMSILFVLELCCFTVDLRLTRLWDKIKTHEVIVHTIIIDHN